MKTKKYIYQFATSIIIVLAAALFTGCLGSLQKNAYTGLPREQVAVLHFDGLYPAFVDGIEVAWSDSKFTRGLLPGHHTICFYLLGSMPLDPNTKDIPHGQLGFIPITMDVNVEAGKEYKVKANKFGTLHGTWSVSITEYHPVGKAEEIILGH